MAYRYRSWKSRKKKNIQIKQSEEYKLIRDIWLVYERCWDLSLNCNRWKLNSNKEFAAALFKWQWNESNPIMKLINDKLWDNDKLYTSLYKYDNALLESWNVLSYVSYWRHAVYVVLDKSEVDNSNAIQSYWYTTLINRLIVKWECRKIEKAIDLFCKTLKKKEWWFIS